MPKGVASVAELVLDMTAGTANGPTRLGPFSRVVSAAATRVLVEMPPEPMMSPVRSFFTSLSSRPESAMACCMEM
jgi:hypothetical protein